MQALYVALFTRGVTVLDFVGNDRARVAATCDATDLRSSLFVE